MSTKHLQTAYSSINLTFSVGDLTPDEVMERLAGYEGGWEFEQATYAEFEDTAVISISVPCSYTAKGANRADIYGLAAKAFHDVTFFVPARCSEIVRLAA